jgi:hypothetical protein
MDYPTNSHRFKEEKAIAPTEERRKVEQLVTGVEKTKKKSEFGKLVNLFISEDAPKIRSWLIHDVAMPAFKKALMGSIDMLFNGGHSSGYTPDYSSKPKVRYSQYSEEPSYRKATGTVVAKNNVEYNDIEYPNRGAAERVLATMRDIHAEFQSVTLAELYEMSGLDHPYTYTKYGWTSLRDAKVVRRGDGYFIDLPPAELVTN